MKIYLSPDEQLVKEIQQKIKENDGYCPCSLEKTEETKCMCKEFKNKKEPCYCHCGLYYKT